MQDDVRPQAAGSAAAFGGRWSRIRFSPLQGVFELLLAWQERAQQRHQLHQMSERELRDMGLSRADIEGECSKPFWCA